MSVTNGKVVICIFNLNLLFPVRSVVEEEKVCFMKTIGSVFWVVLVHIFLIRCFTDMSGTYLLLKIWIAFYL